MNEMYAAGCEFLGAKKGCVQDISSNHGHMDIPFHLQDWNYRLHH